MAENIERATPAQRKELVQLLVERVESPDGHIVAESVAWSGQARPFFASVVVAPPDGLEPPSGKAPDAVAWYATATHPEDETPWRVWAAITVSREHGT
jgi:hypothetical protein